MGALPAAATASAATAAHEPWAPWVYGAEGFDADQYELGLTVDCAAAAAAVASEDDEEGDDEEGDDEEGEDEEGEEQEGEEQEEEAGANDDQQQAAADAAEIDMRAPEADQSVSLDEHLAALCPWAADS